jgi:hypothetical protein
MCWFNHHHRRVRGQASRRLQANVEKEHRHNNNNNNKLFYQRAK